MAHTFDIRFARSVGLAGIFEAPENSFRWKGRGLLRIDRGGISIAVKRGLHSLFPRVQRVAAEDLKEVLREGDALRVEFCTNKASRVVLPFWVRDQDMAAEIVRLLPTTNSVEMDHDAAGVGRGRFRPDWRFVSIVGLLLLGLTGLAVLRAERELPVKAAAAPDLHIPAVLGAAAPGAVVAPPNPTRSKPSEDPQVASRTSPASAADEVRSQDISPPVEMEPPNPYAAIDSPATDASASSESMAVALEKYAAPPRQIVYVRTTDGVVPIVPEMPVYETARRQLELFKYEAGPLDQVGNVSELNLWNATVRIYNDPALDNADLWALREMELAVSRAWRSCVADLQCELAQRLTKRLELYVR